MPDKSQHPDPDSTDMVVLCHTLLDGSSHFDWLIELPGRDDDHRLLSFRCSSRPDQWGGEGAFHAEHMPDHRAKYLTFEGDIGDGRGSVARVASGRCVHRERSDRGDSIRIVLLWESDPAGSSGEPQNQIQVFGLRIAEKHWSFRVV